MTEKETISDVRKELREDYTYWTHSSKGRSEQVSGSKGKPLRKEQIENIKRKFNSEITLVNNVAVTANKLLKRLKEEVVKL